MLTAKAIKTITETWGAESRIKILIVNLVNRLFNNE